MNDLTKTSLHRFIETIDWMTALRSVCHHPIVCTVDSPAQASMLRSVQSFDEVSGPSVSIQI